MTLTKLEQAVLDTFLTGDDSLRTILRRQVAAATLTREETGVGFFIQFSLSDYSPQLPELESIWFSDIQTEIEGLKYGAGFVLMVRNGLIDYLEGYTYGDERWPINTDDFEIVRVTTSNVADPKTVAKLSSSLKV